MARSKLGIGMIRIANSDFDVGDILFPREPALLMSTSDISSNLFTRLSGTVSLKKGSQLVTTTSDLTLELARNDVIIIDGIVFRVSSASMASSLKYKRARETRISNTKPEGIEADTLNGSTQSQKRLRIDGIDTEKEKDSFRDCM